MGWTFTHRPQGQSTLDFFRQEFGDGVLDAATHGTQEAYLAFRTQEGSVIAVVCLTQWKRNDHFNFGYKDMGEGMGPNAANCPERILRQLTDHNWQGELAAQWSAEWRKKAWENVRAKRSRPALQVGDIIRFPEPLRFRNGDELQELKVVSLRPLRFVDPAYPWTRYKVGQEHLRSAEVARP